MRLTLMSGLLAGLLIAAGCRSKPEPADPGKSREALQSVLSAWQNGEAAESLRQHKPPITAVDPRWREKYRLVRFEVADGGNAAGFDHRYRVQLWLQTPDGREVQEDALFTVSTKPELVVMREES
jgi:hypothetical protein